MLDERPTPTLILNQADISARGPTPYSHWVIPKLLLASAYPSEKDPVEHQARARQMIDAGVQVVVNMVEEQEMETRTPYRNTMQELARQVNRQIEFLAFPIPDRSVHKDSRCVLDFCLGLCDRLRRGQVVLIHCLGGHGRTGIIASIIIGIIGDLNSADALLLNGRLHDQREVTRGFSSPETGRQSEQVRYVLDELYRSSEIYQPRFIPMNSKLLFFIVCLLTYFILIIQSNSDLSNEDEFLERRPRGFGCNGPTNRNIYPCKLHCKSRHFKGGRCSKSSNYTRCVCYKSPE